MAKIRAAIIAGRFGFTDRQHRMKHILTGLALLLFATSSYAESRYVQDQLEITMRTGESTRNSIIRMLASGDRVELLETNPDSGYSKVRTRDGTEGWVLTRFLMTEPAARQQLAALRVQAATLREEQRQRETELDGVRAENASLKSQLADMEGRFRQASRELAEIRKAASNVLAVNENNKALSQEITDIQQQLDKMNAEADQLRRDTTRRWFMTGAGVAFGGLLLGLLIPRLRWRKSSSWGSL